MDLLDVSHWCPNHAFFFFFFYRLWLLQESADSFENSESSQHKVFTSPLLAEAKGSLSYIIFAKSELKDKTFLYDYDSLSHAMVFLNTSFFTLNQL